MMDAHVRSIRGMHDRLPHETRCLRRIEDALRRALTSYGYEEIRLPVVEHIRLFRCSLGDRDDIVRREMYNFRDKNHDVLALRPEGTAGCVRAVGQHRLLYHNRPRLWYTGPMFRRERPQRGRYRQFHQLGVEAFGHSGPEIDAELVMWGTRCWRRLGIDDDVVLEINSLGSFDDRQRYCRALSKFLEERKEQLDRHAQRAMYVNPMRVLDTKNPQTRSALDHVPVLNAYLNDRSRRHFRAFCDLLDAVKIDYRINPRLVRGMGYYNDTVFEWTTRAGGAQNAICGGGRYDDLVRRVHDYSAPAVGLAVGLERLMHLSMQRHSPSSTSTADVYCAFDDRTIRSAVVLFAENLRHGSCALRIVVHCGRDPLKRQFACARRCGARVVLLFHEDAFRLQQVVWKSLRTGRQRTLPRHAVEDRLRVFFRGRPTAS